MFVPKKDSEMKPVLKPYSLYHTDNGRIVCGNHAGTSAKYTGRDISGQRVKKVTRADEEAWLAELGEPIQCEECQNIGEREAETHKPPARILYKSSHPWTCGTARGVHAFAVEMRLFAVHPYGAEYVLVKVISETGAPPTDPRSAPDKMGIAWHAIARFLAEGSIAPIEEDNSCGR